MGIILNYPLCNQTQTLLNTKLGGLYLTLNLKETNKNDEKVALIMFFLNSETHKNSNFLIYILVLICLLKVMCKVNSGDNNQLFRNGLHICIRLKIVPEYINKSSKINKKIANSPIEKRIKELAMHGKGDLNGQ